MPSTRLSDIEEVPGCEAGPDVTVSAPCPRELESDYYLGGYDIDSDYLPAHDEEFLSEDQLPPPLPTDEDFPEPYMVMPAKPLVSKKGSSGHQIDRPHIHQSRYLPPHHLPPGELPHRDTSVSGVCAGNGDTANSLNMQLTVGASSALDMSAPCGLSDCEHGSVDELCQGVTHISDSQQQTEV